MTFSFAVLALALGLSGDVLPFANVLQLRHDISICLNGCQGISTTDHASIGLLIAIGVRLYREDLGGLLQGEKEILVLGTVADEASAVARAGILSPNVVLLDTKLPNSLSAVPALLEAAPDSRVIALGVTEMESEVIAYAKAGVSGYVAREGSFEDLLVTIRSVAKGELICSPQVAAALLREVARSGAEAGMQVGQLTSREKQIAELIDKGCSNKQIASNLRIEVSTVKNHVHHILEKLHATRRGQAAAQLRAALFSQRAAQRSVSRS